MFQYVGNRSTNQYIFDLSSGTFDNVTDYSGMFNFINKDEILIYVKDKASQDWIINKN